MIIIWTKTLMPGMGLGKSPAGRRFDDESGDEVKKVMNEIRLRVSHLRYIGVSEVVIRSLFQQEIQLSRLVITEDFRILLPDAPEMRKKYTKSLAFS